MLIIEYTLIFTCVLTLVALGACFAEHSGIVNIGLEGIMIIGALGGAFVLRFYPPQENPLVLISLTILVSSLCGLLFSFLLAVASINFKADQIIAGTAVNMLGVAAAAVTVKMVNLSINPHDFSSVMSFLENKKFLMLTIGDINLSWFMPITLIILIISYILLYKTRFGLRLMACGEFPQAADSAGINVAKMQYAGVAISGLLGGFGGIVYITSGVSEWTFENGVSGFGFLALAVLIFGQWKPQCIVLAAFLFGLLRSLSKVYVGFDFLVDLNIPANVYNMLPYIICLLVLAAASAKSRAPKAEGIPYDKEKR